MLSIESVAQNLQDASAMNGWDAVFAMNLEQVNALFFQQFLDIGPTNPRAQTFLRCALSDDDSSMWILDVGLGPAELSLAPGDADATVALELIKGVLITVDPNAMAIVNATWVRPNESKLTGSLALAKVKGEVNQLGAVVMDLGASAYTPTISGVDPTSVLNTKIGEAAQTFFHANAATYTLGIIGNADVATSLTPTVFHVTTQRHPTKPDSCVVILIQTDGQPGNVAPLDSYPVPDGSSVALLIADRPLFEALSADLTKTFAQFGTTFSSRQAPGGAATVGSGGHVDCGSYGNFFDCNHEDEWDHSPKMPWTSDANGNLQSVQIGLDGFTISASDGQLVVAWSQKHAQNVSSLYRNPPVGILPSLCATRTNLAALQVDFGVSGSPTVDPGSSIVSFTFSNPALSVKAVDNPGFWEWLWGATSITGDVTATIKTNLLGTLNSFTVVTIDAFRLKCLLFQSPDTVQLTGAALPNGVFLTGAAKMPLLVTPASTQLAPGATVQFTATPPAGSTLYWEISPLGFGYIDPTTGLYKAPASVSTAQVVVVTAVDRAKTDLYGSAMVLVHESPAAQGVAVLPIASLVTPGHHVNLSTTDAAGQPLTVTWTLPPDSGSIRPAFKQGEYIYTAPPQLSAVTKVTATAVNAANPAQSGSALIQLTPSSSIAVQPAQVSVKLDSKLPLTATVTAGDPEHLRWVVYPASSGTVAFDLSDPTKATYIAPGRATSGNQVTVVAYLVDGQAAGLGSAAIMLTS